MSANCQILGRLRYHHNKYYYNWLLQLYRTRSKKVNDVRPLYGYGYGCTMATATGLLQAHETAVQHFCNSTVDFPSRQTFVCRSAIILCISSLNDDRIESSVSHISNRPFSGTHQIAYITVD